MTKPDVDLMTSLPACDSGSTAAWGSKRIKPRPQFCLCLTWCDTSPNDKEEEQLFLIKARCRFTQYMPEKSDKFGIKLWLAVDQWFLTFFYIFTLLTKVVTRFTLNILNDAYLLKNEISKLLQLYLFNVTLPLFFGNELFNVW